MWNSLKLNVKLCFIQLAQNAPKYVTVRGQMNKGRCDNCHINSWLSISYILVAHLRFRPQVVKKEASLVLNESSLWTFRKQSTTSVFTIKRCIIQKGVREFRMWFDFESWYTVIYCSIWLSTICKKQTLFYECYD